ncbi:MAG: hypothetical protein RXR09_02140 [Acidilobus sp.]
MARSRRRAISDIVAVVMLIIIAIAAAVLVYAWMGGLIGGMHSSNSGLYSKIEIVGANISSKSGGSPYTVSASVENLGNTLAVINYMAVEYTTNSSVICSSSATNAISPNTISPSSVETLQFSCSSSSSIPAGTPVTIVVLTTDGVTATYQTAWP